jgi:hypothetical protein
MDKFSNIYFAEHQELFNSHLLVKDVKNIIKKITGIEEKNQRIGVSFNIYNDDDQYFWNYQGLIVYDISKYNLELSSEGYKTNIVVDLRKKIKELKQNIYELTNISISRQQIFLNDKELNSEDIVEHEDLIKNNFYAKIKRELNNSIYIKYNSEIKQITTDLHYTGLELLKQIHNNSDNLNIKYGLIYKNKYLALGNLLISSGIQNGDLIELIDRKSLKEFLLYVKTLTNKVIPIYVAPCDSIRTFKHLIELKEGIPINEQRLVYNRIQLEDNRTIEDYNFKEESTINLILRIRGGNVNI